MAQTSSHDPCGIVWKAGKENPFLDSALRSWQHAIALYADFHRKSEDGRYYDMGFWHGERANVSLLAASVWACGGIALQDYGALRHHTPMSSKPIGGYPQVDLFLSDRDHGYVLEAKLSRPSWPLDNTGKLATGFRRQLGMAERDVRSVRDAVSKQLAALFVVPKISVNPGQHRASLRKQVDEFVAHVLSALDCLTVDVVAAYFPLEWRLSDDPYASARVIYPGVALCMTVVKS
jgi:hypothetical protein